jgi:WXG100 family type VII secretion target
VDGLIVDFAGLRTLVAGIDKSIEEIEGLLDDLGRTINTLTELWAGSAAEGFRRTQADWFAAADDLRARLAGLRDMVVTAHDNHASAVRTNTKMWRM